MDKLFEILLDYSSEASDKKTRVLVTLTYYFTSIILSIWLGEKLGFKFISIEFTVKCFVSLVSDLSIVVPLILFIMVNSITTIIVYFLVILFYIFFKILRYFSYKKATRKSNLLVLICKEVVDYKDDKIVKGKKFDEYIAKMISDKRSSENFKKIPPKMPVVIFSIWFIYVQIIRLQFENLYFLWFCILLSFVVISMVLLMGSALYFTYRISLDEKYLISFELLDKNYSDSIKKSNS